MTLTKSSLKSILVSFHIHVVNWTTLVQINRVTLEKAKSSNVIYHCPFHLFNGKGIVFKLDNIDSINNIKFLGLQKQRWSIENFPLGTTISSLFFFVPNSNFWVDSITFDELRMFVWAEFPTHSSHQHLLYVLHMHRHQ